MNGTQKIKNQLATMYGTAEANAHTVRRGFCLHRNAYGWIIQRFGQNERFLGQNLTVALEGLREEHEARLEQVQHSNELLGI